MKIMSNFAFLDLSRQAISQFVEKHAHYLYFGGNLARGCEKFTVPDIAGKD